MKNTYIFTEDVLSPSNLPYRKSITALVDMNGTTDYLEFVAETYGATSAQIGGSFSYISVQGHLVHQGVNFQKGNIPESMMKKRLSDVFPKNNRKVARQL